MPEFATHNAKKKSNLALILLCAFGISMSLNCRGNAQDSPTEEETPRPESSHLPLPTAEELAKLPPDGGPKFNRLVFESSPYLLQHARNPVDWFPWGDEAFARAKREGKAVFLSVGYSTCHWCHVMERESFESAEIAELLNRHFICVKVDREERPDVDKIYMAALQAQTGRGGWPMSIFLAPDRRPFWCGTYFPPEDQGRRPGFKTVIASLAGAWKDHRTDVLARAESITKALRARTRGGGEVALNEATLRAGYTLFERTFDSEQGGFGPAPKFPRSHSFSFLLRWSLREPKSDAVAMVESTLDHLSRGGIRDHLGGGYHRYSTDREWLLPHFEKMLYDQALLARSFLEAYQVTGRASHAQEARDILDYVLRDMTDPRGAFYSAEDADSEGEEGKFYVWHRSEIIKHLGKTDGEFFSQVYGVTEEGNFRDEATGKKTGANILHLPRSLAQVAAAQKTDVTALSKRLAQLRGKLFLLRKGRIHPLKDDTILSDWNGLMISTLAYAGQALGEDRYTRAAVMAANFITKEMMKKGRLLHRYRDGKATIEGFLDDHAFLALGLLDLYETTLDPRWLNTASNLAEAMLALFWDQESAAFHFSGVDSEGLIAKSKDVYDGAVPSGNSVATLVLLRLGRLTTDSKMEKAARQTLAHFSGQISNRPTAYPFMLMALDFSIGPTREITLAGTFGTPEFLSMRRAVHQRFLPRKVLAGHPGGAEASAVRKLIPYVEKQVAMDGQATAYLCENYSCRLPIRSLPELEKALRDFNPPQADKPRKK